MKLSHDKQVQALKRKDRIAELEERVTIRTEGINQLHDKLDAANQRIAELEAQLTELRGELTTVQNAHSKALANNTALRKWITKLEGK